MAFWDRVREGMGWEGDRDERDRRDREEWSGRERDDDRPYDRGYRSDYGRTSGDYGRTPGTYGRSMSGERDYGRPAWQDRGRIDRDFERPGGFRGSERDGGWSSHSRDYGEDWRGGRGGEIDRMTGERGRWRMQDGYGERGYGSRDLERDSGRGERYPPREIDRGGYRSHEFDRGTGYGTRSGVERGIDRSGRDMGHRDGRSDFERDERDRWSSDDWDRNRNRW